MDGIDLLWWFFSMKEGKLWDFVKFPISDLNLFEIPLFELHTFGSHGMWESHWTEFLDRKLFVSSVLIKNFSNEDRYLWVT